MPTKTGAEKRKELMKKRAELKRFKVEWDDHDPVMVAAEEGEGGEPQIAEAIPPDDDGFNTADEGEGDESRHLTPQTSTSRRPTHRGTRTSSSSSSSSSDDEWGDLWHLPSSSRRTPTPRRHSDRYDELRGTEQEPETSSQTTTPPPSSRWWCCFGRKCPQDPYGTRGAKLKHKQTKRKKHTKKRKNKRTKQKEKITKKRKTKRRR